jgi:hypothetical protein
MQTEDPEVFDTSTETLFLNNEFLITSSCCFSFDNGNLHVFDFNSNEKEVYFSNDDVFQMVPRNKKL